ncbi:MAG: M24 family metallopeptidase, partial [Gracilibacteraceae bacterium]|nr:M24 family metallopeptidase [Gracilibacteraceae bacterium]
MSPVFHERLKSPVPIEELERRARALQAVLARENIDCLLAQNLTQYMGGCNRWMTDTTAENNYPQSSFLPRGGEVRYIACSGPPLDLYPPPHLLRIGQPWAAAPYFSVFNFTNDWEGRLFVQWAKENSAKRIGVAGLQMMQWNYYEYIAAHLPAAEIVDVSSYFDELRAVKSQVEIDFLRRSAAVQDKAMGYLGAFALPGAREYEIRAQVMRLLTDWGGEEMIVTIGSAPRGEKFDLLPSFYQNRELAAGDTLYVKLQSSGPGGLFSTLGRMFSVGREPSEALMAGLTATQKAQEKLTGLLEIGMSPAAVYARYNDYLAAEGWQKETGLFAHGQGYDHVERPSLQSGETLPLAKDMCLAVNTDLVSATGTVYLADSFLLKPQGAQKLHDTPP